MHKATVTMTFDTKTKEQAELIKKFFFDAQALMTCENSTFEGHIIYAPHGDDDVTAAVFRMREEGFYNYHHEDFRPDVRVRNAGQQYPEAVRNGTATVVCVMRNEGDWEEKCGRKNLEVLVRRDSDRTLTWWADYATVCATGELED